jgi:hypothetical protein
LQKYGMEASAYQFFYAMSMSTPAWNQYRNEALGFSVLYNG